MVSTKEVGLYLEAAAKARSLIFYSQLAGHFGLSLDLHPWSNHPLSWLLGELDLEDDRLKRPFRTALVVSREQNMPGEGFFATIAQLRGTPINKDNKLTIWLSEFEAVCDHHY